MNSRFRIVTALCSLAMLLSAVAVLPSAEPSTKSFDPTAEALGWIKEMKVKPSDWPQWAGSPSRNNVPEGTNIATKWNLKTGENIKWSANLGSQTYGNPVVANCKVYVGTNN